MTPKAHKGVLIVNTVLCLIAIPLALMLQVGTVMGGAAAYEQRSQVLGMTIVYLGLACLFVPPVSIIGSWAALKWQRISMAFVFLPYVYALLFVLAFVLLYYLE